MIDHKYEIRFQEGLDRSVCASLLTVTDDGVSCLKFHTAPCHTLSEALVLVGIFLKQGFAKELDARLKLASIKASIELALQHAQGKGWRSSDVQSLLLKALEDL